MMHLYTLNNNLLNLEECSELIKFAKNSPSEIIEDSPAPGKKVKVVPVEYYKFNDQLNFFFELVESKNRELWEFDLYPRLKSDPIFFNFYSGNKNEYSFHFDGNTSTPRSDIKLTAIVNISQEPYQGGELELFFGNKIEKIESLNISGNMIIFPSFIYHRVTPVTSGERVSMSFWFIGPNWR